MGQRPEQTTHQRRYTNGKQAYEKMLYMMSPGKGKLKWGTTTHLFEWQKSGILTTSNAGENVEE